MLSRCQSECHGQLTAIAVVPRISNQRIQRRGGQRADAAQLLETTDRLMFASDRRDLPIGLTHPFVELL